MQWKKEPGDFRVDERLREGYLQRSGPFRVYRVVKRKLTSLEAAAALAELAGVSASDVELAGLKDRQGVTSQFMSIRGGRPVSLRTPDLSIEVAGSARVAISPKESEGNSFRIRLRELSSAELARAQRALPVLRALGVANYFDEQRFGNLRYGQGWVARELMLGRAEAALRALLGASSPRDDRRNAAFKEALARHWGDWQACRDAAGRLGAHHSVFEHLRREPQDFAGAFAHVSARLRLIHLYAFQSHVWNRAVARLLAHAVGRGRARVLDSLEGPLVFPEEPVELDPALAGCLRLPGAGLEDVRHPLALELFEDVLAGLGLVADQFRIEGVPGFALKGEDRALFVRPLHLRADLSDAQGAAKRQGRALLSFDLPRGAYATLLVRMLFASELEGDLELLLREREALHAARARAARSSPEKPRPAHAGRRGRPRPARRGRPARGGEAAGRSG